MHLPDLEICYHYPMIGPEENSIDNINGRACSIELFLGKDIRRKRENIYLFDGVLISVK